jgi:xanthine dehydrogenase accessory factor
MYGIALTVAACLRAGTRADVAWVLEADGLPVDDWSDAMVLTPGGGRIGSLVGGAADGHLTDLAGHGSVGRIADVEVTEVDALIAGLASPGRARLAIAPADLIPAETWPMAEERRAFCLVGEVSGSEITGLRVYTDETTSEAGEDVAGLFASGAIGSTLAEGKLISIFRAAPRLVVVGDTPIGRAVADAAGLLGWRVTLASDTATATGAIATMSALDKVVVTGHDLELAGTALMSALESRAGYIGAVGARHMQETRADWLAYRGVTDLSRVRGPAGLDIGADSPGEIAVSILAEAILEHAPVRGGTG